MSKKQEKNYYQMLCKAGYKKEVDGIIDRNNGDIDRTFLGFLDIYEALAKIIPTDKVVYDLGCGYGFQSYFFRKHKKFIMVNHGTSDIFKMPNSKFYSADIHDFLKGRKVEGNHFAICSYVPLKGGYGGIKAKFRDLFIYYP